MTKRLMDTGVRPVALVPVVAHMSISRETAAWREGPLLHFPGTYTSTRLQTAFI